ncbi:MAG: hypothetical protein GF411_18680 [Candidatus Lokiarchaeota archaeon]|nr:hypothetical protein [Candidatus Lokiarchaeota archaeon]
MMKYFEKMGHAEKRNYTIIIVGAIILGFFEFFVFPNPPPFWWSVVLLASALLLMLLLWRTIKMSDKKKKPKKKSHKSRRKKTDKTKLYLNIARVVFLVSAAFLIYEGLLGIGGLFTFYGGIACIGITAIISVILYMKYD